MFASLAKAFICSFLFAAHFLSATVDYEFHDIGTLQTHSSCPIAINNKGQILAWYNINGMKGEKTFFLREKNGKFYQIQSTYSGIAIDWKYLTNTGAVYGICKTGNMTSLFMWEPINGIVSLGALPGKEIAAINDKGQVLIVSTNIKKDNKSISRPAIWHNGKITYLKGLDGELGIESSESYGFDMNNKGEVVGQSLVSLVHKNNVYYQQHAVKWKNGKATDLHYKLPKSTSSFAAAINDNGRIIFNRNDVKINCNNTYTETRINGINPEFYFSITNLNMTIQSDARSNWMKVNKFIAVNENHEIVAEGETIYGEKHALLLIPIDR